SADVAETERHCYATNERQKRPCLDAAQLCQCDFHYYYCDACRFHNVLRSTLVVMLSCDESAVTARDAFKSTLSQNLVSHAAVPKRTRQFLFIKIVREPEVNRACFIKRL